MYFTTRTVPFVITILTVATSLTATPALILTPLIKQNKLEQARNASTVNPKDFLNTTSYSAFLTVDERYNSNLFYWYFPVAKEGLIMGNPVTDRSSIVDYTRVFYNWGLVDAQGALAAKALQEQYQKAINDGDNIVAHSLREDLLDKLQDIAYKNQLNNVLQNTEGLRDLVPFITRPQVKESLHVGDLSFTFSNGTVHRKIIPDFLSPVTPKIDVLLESYKILIYCGQLDLLAPCVLSAEARRKNWQWSRRENFLDAPRVPWWFNNTVAGYVKSGGNLTEVQVNGAGHIVPADKPAQAKHIVENFINGQDFLVPPDYKVTGANPKYQEYTDLRTSQDLPNSSGIRNGLIASVVLNVLLLVGIVIGGVMTMRWKRENDYFNLPLSDDILTLA
ncbi:jg7198 [Pararge aegeria aegeria]|uniref:Jg7198 protein n=1 Tax=Pararge aegeria aegeria TaxID=348720 RepID=A0A8S4R8Y4_9NEOP|nr:jg7198 [Pararge aegeria aegeria]